MTDVRVLSAADVERLVSLPDLLPVAERALVKQGRGEAERPPRPHFPVGAGRPGGDGGEHGTGERSDPAGTGLVMPAYVHGDETYATKLAAVHPGNPGRGLPTVNAQIAVNDADTGLPRAFLHGNRVTNARTGCIGGLAARELGASPVRLGVFGAGAQARWQTRAIATATDLESVRVYAPSDSREACAADLRAELGDEGEDDAAMEGAVEVRAVDSPEAALADANVVVTATTASEPVFRGSALEPGTLVVAVGAYAAETRELDAETFARAARVFADVPEEAAEIGDLRGTGLDAADLLPFSDALEGSAGREADDEILVVESVGTAVLDAAAAGWVNERASAEGVGTTVEF